MGVGTVERSSVQAKQQAGGGERRSLRKERGGGEEGKGRVVRDLRWLEFMVMAPPARKITGRYPTDGDGCAAPPPACGMQRRRMAASALGRGQVNQEGRNLNLHAGLAA